MKKKELKRRIERAVEENMRLDRRYLEATEKVMAVENAYIELNAKYEALQHYHMKLLEKVGVQHGCLRIVLHTLKYIERKREEGGEKQDCIKEGHMAGYIAAFLEGLFIPEEKQA